MGKLLAGLLKGLAEVSEKALSKLLAKVVLLFKELATWIAELLPKVLVKVLLLFSGLAAWIVELLSKNGPDGIASIAKILFARFITENEQVREAAYEMNSSLAQALLMDYIVAFAVLVSCFITLVVFIGFPLIYKALFRRRLGIFISFNNTREAIAEYLAQCLNAEGVRVYRIPYQEGATHQHIVIQATDGIKKCDSFVCLPGDAQSYVEHEVLAAATAGKPITFLISESSGTLPNTADKRYPVFRLEATIREQFKPLIIFLGYVGADLLSTWKLCQRALFNPFMSIPVSVVQIYSGVCFFGLLAYCFYDTMKHGYNLAHGFPASTEFKTAIILSHAFILGLLVLIVFMICSYVFLFVINLLRQFHARRRARLKAVDAQFNRDDWIGVVSDLSPGGDIYECLFEAAPAAHHEIKGKGDDL